MAVIMSAQTNQTVIEFITITRGGSDGLIAVIEMNGEAKYFELPGIQSMLKTYTQKHQYQQLQKAIAALLSTDNLDDIAEFEGGLPIQGSLF